ncbi:MAG TPA: YtxH domain-containing protein [Fibrella sp.]|jgi:gas vesicle protein
MNSFLTGLATGLAVGYLTAPRSGKETRQQLVDTANKQKEGLKAQLDKTVSQAKDLVGKVKSQAGASGSTPNVFADMGSTNGASTDNAGYLADPVLTDINNAETL